MTWDFLIVFCLALILPYTFLLKVIDEMSKARQEARKLDEQLRNKNNELKQIQDGIAKQGRLVYLKTWDGVYYELRVRKILPGDNINIQAAGVVCDWQDCDCEQSCAIACKHGEPLHFHHDGCPACDEV